MSIYDNDPILDALNTAAASREQARDEYDDTIDGYDREIEIIQGRKTAAVALREIEAEALDALIAAAAERRKQLVNANLLADGRLPVGEEV